jgi:hypothetical protein
MAGVEAHAHVRGTDRIEEALDFLRGFHVCGNRGDGRQASGRTQLPRARPPR